MTFTHKNKGTCSSEVRFDIEDGVLRNVRFTGGCSGNLKAIGKLTEGMNAEKVVELLEGNTCGSKPTSCADQLALAIKQAIAEEAKG